MKRTGYVVLGVICFLIFSIIISYNGLVNKQEKVNNAWGQVQTVYQRRLDLIPNLVATVKGYAAHEKDTLVAVTKARQSVINLQGNASELNAHNFKAIQQAQQGVSSALGRLMVVVERYPDLKASQNFLALQAELEGTENRISVERHRYNNAARVYDTKIRKFPTVIVARLFNFTAKPYFQANQQAAQAPKVSF